MPDEPLTPLTPLSPTFTEQSQLLPALQHPPRLQSAQHVQDVPPARPWKYDVPSMQKWQVGVETTGSDLSRRASCSAVTALLKSKSEPLCLSDLDEQQQQQQPLPPAPPMHPKVQALSGSITRLPHSMTVQSIADTVMTTTYSDTGSPILGRLKWASDYKLSDLAGTLMPPSPTVQAHGAAPSGAAATRPEFLSSSTDLPKSASSSTVNTEANRSFCEYLDADLADADCYDTHTNNNDIFPTTPKGDTRREPAIEASFEQHCRDIDDFLAMDPDRMYLKQQWQPSRRPASDVSSVDPSKRSSLAQLPTSPDQACTATTSSTATAAEKDTSSLTLRDRWDSYWRAGSRSSSFSSFQSARPCDNSSETHV